MINEMYIDYYGNENSGMRAGRTYFPEPERMPEPGDVYVFLHGGKTLGNDKIRKGDLLYLNCRTNQRPFGHISSYGNWVVSHDRKGTKVSIWSGIELMLADRDIKLLAVK